MAKSCCCAVKGGGCCCGGADCAGARSCCSAMPPNSPNATNVAATRRRGRKAAGKRYHHQSVEHEQCQGGEEYWSAQVERLSLPVRIKSRIERRDIKLRRAVGRCQRIHSDQAFRRPVELGRVVEASTFSVVAGNRSCGWRRRRECAESIEDTGWRHNLGRARA